MANLIQAAIFDMDGLLVDSEPLWKEAEIRVFGQLGVNLTNEMCHETEGFRLDEAVKYWYDRYHWQGPMPKDVENAILVEMNKLMSERGAAMDGVHQILELFKKRELKIGLASSSTMNLIEGVVDKLHIRRYFDVLWSAQYEIAGKPNPAVYLTTAKKLGVSPASCVAFEDSINGLMAAHNAGMRTVAVPYAAQANLPKYNIADLKLRSLADFSEDMLISLMTRATLI